MIKLKNQRGITLVSLIITIILMLIIAGVSIKFSKEAINKTKLEDIETNMLLIQAKAKTIYERFTFKEIESLTGVEYDPNNPQNIDFYIRDELKNKISGETGKFYIWGQNDYNINGLSTIKIDNENFYIIDYETGEIYYSLGYYKDGITYYSLTELQGI